MCRRRVCFSADESFSAEHAAAQKVVLLFESAFLLYGVATFLTILKFLQLTGLKQELPARGNHLSTQATC